MDPFVAIKSQMWNRWFQSAIPMLDNQTPIDAAKTPRGRKKLDELLAFYDKMSADMPANGSPNCNVPTKYAKWKLGYGQGSPQEFIQEESILNYQSSSQQRPTVRKERHTQRLEKKKVAIWIPMRCEVSGCLKRGDDVKSCSSCGCAYYCGKDHQNQDWNRHKLDCKASRKFGDLQARPFDPMRELEKYPLLCFPIDGQGDEKQMKCFVCHSSSKEVDITSTKCCNLPVCDNSHEYQQFSYSRDFCERSHLMYTACAHHMQEGHEGDWRSCAKCCGVKNNVRRFLATNGFCATPCLEKFMPQGSMIITGCDNRGCKNRMIPGHSKMSFANGKQLCVLNNTSLQCKEVNAL